MTTRSERALPFVSFRNPREACSAIGEVADQKIGELVRRPWNAYEPDETSWWLVPSTDWPAFGCGKFCFDWGADDRLTILCGLHIEKGLNPRVDYASPTGKRLIMQSHWTWFKLLDDLKKRKIAKAIAEAAQEAQLPIDVRIDGGYISDPEFFDPFALHFPQDIYLLQWEHDSNTFTLQESTSEAGLLGELANVRTIDDLSHALETLGANHWIWLDVFIALRLYIHQADSAVSEPQQFWDAERIWERFLGHLHPWVV